MDWTLLLITMLLGLINYIVIDQAPEDAETPTVRAVLLGGWALVSVAASLFVPTIYRACREPMLPARRLRGDVDIEARTGAAGDTVLPYCDSQARTAGVCRADENTRGYG